MSNPDVAILHAVKHLGWHIVQTESEDPFQQIVSKGEDCSFDSQTLLFNYTVSIDLSHQELTAHVQHRALLSLHHLEQHQSRVIMNNLKNHVLECSIKLFDEATCLWMIQAAVNEFNLLSFI